MNEPECPSYKSQSSSQARCEHGRIKLHQAPKERIGYFEARPEVISEKSPDASILSHHNNMATDIKISSNWVTCSSHTHNNLVPNFCLRCVIELPTFLLSSCLPIKFFILKKTEYYLEIKS